MPGAALQNALYATENQGQLGPLAIGENLYGGVTGGGVINLPGGVTLGVGRYPDQPPVNVGRQPGAISVQVLLLVALGVLVILAVR